MEALFQQGFALNSPSYFLAIFSGSVIYYTTAYISDGSGPTVNPRTLWYKQNRGVVRRSQWVMFALLVSSSALILRDGFGWLFKMSPLQWFLILIFPVAAIFYYGLSTKLGKYNLRSIGWLKPFVIGFIWAGLVTVYPVLFYDLIHVSNYALNPIGVFLFVKNFMFVSVLCIMFDIKDYAMDYNAQLKTFVVKVGLRRTIFQIIIPLCVIGLASFLVYGILRGFHWMKLSINVIPFFLLIIVAYSLHNRRSVLYYLIIIDGLMLVKAVCGSLAMLYF